MQATRARLLIRKVYENGFTWLDLENYFNINRNTLKDEVKAYFDKSGKGVPLVLSKISSNENSTII